MDGLVDDKDILINILLGQRNSLMDQITGLTLQIEKMKPFMPKDPVKHDDKPK